MKIERTRRHLLSDDFAAFAVLGSFKVPKVFSRTAAPRDWMIGLWSSRHQRNGHQEVASPSTNNSEVIDTVHFV